ncbi:heat shock factor protein 5 [Anoplopoma fimbria]|uniref:heat shock factor protein 5 n=1 Tax=Anoplopoma fimbria TaxID=229290 RepID=UPI0023EB6DF8|nr:heat shock factor protein 5 [Anoplopoma fimbria]
MDVSESPLPESINPNNFPAKLWRLVNNPVTRAISWDKLGQTVVIDQHLFEEKVLSPSSSGGGESVNADAFKTTNFSSFVRQLNLYGFKKADATVIDSDAADHVQYHYFYNPNFKRNQPERVASLRRLTVHNKAKIQAGLDVRNRPPSRYLRYSAGDGRDKDGKRGSYSLMSPTHQESTHPYHPNKYQAMTAHNGTPVPPRFLTRGHGAALSPTVFASDKGIPVSLSQHYTAAASSSTAMHIQQSLMACANHGNPNFTFNAQYQPGYYSPLCQCYHPNLVASQMAGSGLQTGSFSTHSYYQASYPVNVLCHLDNNQDSKNMEHQEAKKCDINLDTIFQIADEVMQTPPNSSLVRVVTPQKPGPVLVPFSANTVLCDSPASTTKANSLSPGPSVAVTGRADLVTFQQQEESVISPPEQMPEDAIFKVTIDDAKDTEVISVEVNDTLTDTSQAYNSTCTRSPTNLYRAPLARCWSAPLRVAGQRHCSAPPSLCNVAFRCYSETPPPLSDSTRRHQHSEQVESVNESQRQTGSPAGRPLGRTHTCTPSLRGIDL